jgi:phosphatidylserine/phosphatidylglycerophosphate/cardiolipin synthase-like enzyme
MLLSLLLSLLPWVEAAAEVYPIREGNHVTVLQDPADALRRKIALIKRANHHIHIMTYYWDDSPVGLEVANAVRAALDRGVEVRVLSTRIPTRATDPGMKIREILKPPTADGRRAVVHFAGPVGYPFGVFDNIHEKLLLIDGEVAVIGGRNFSSFIWDARDCEFLLEGPVVQDLQRHFKKMLDFVAEGHAAMECGKRQTDCYRQWLLDTFAQEPLYFDAFRSYADGVKARLITHSAPLEDWGIDLSREQRLEQNDDIVETLANAEFQTLRIYNYFLLHTPRVRDFLVQSIEGGKEIEIITNSLESSAYLSELGYRVALPEAATLPEGDVSYYLWRSSSREKYLHAKVVILDDDHVIVGSHNFTTASTAVSSELAVEIWSRPVASDLIAMFDADKQLCDEVDVAFFQEQLLELRAQRNFQERVFRPVMEFLY